MPTQAEIRQAITNRIVEALQNGNLPPWRQTWANDPNCGRPANITSQKTYRGINPLLLQIASMRHGFKTRWWATYRQWDTLGCHVMRRPDNVPPGEWGTNITFWKPVAIAEKNDDGDDDKKTIFVLRTYTVFNLDTQKEAYRQFADFINKAVLPKLQELAHYFDPSDDGSFVWHFEWPHDPSLLVVAMGSPNRSYGYFYTAVNLVAKEDVPEVVRPEGYRTPEAEGTEAARQRRRGKDQGRFRRI